MAAHRLAEAARHLSRRFGPDDRSDGQLLARFLDYRDADALGVLVRRHGPMVLGVCRRQLGDGPDADDAFQATFLVLVRKANSVRPRERVGFWLYGVARTTAVRAKAARVKRLSREGPLVDAPDPRVDSTDDRLALLDLELSRLPEKYRVPIVLCDLGGKSHAEAAAELGWPVGTLSGRLSRGRAMLAGRLRRPGAVGAAVAAAGVPEGLTAATVRLAAGGAVPARVLVLTEGVVKAMLMSKLKVAVPVLVALVAAGSLGYRMQAADGPAKPAAGEPRPDHVRAMNLAREKDKAALQGVWELTDGWVMSGKHTIDFQGENAIKLFLLVANDRAEVFSTDVGRFEKTTGLDYPKGVYGVHRFDLGASGSPKQIDLTDDDKDGDKTFGLYALDGDRLTFCGQMPEDGRPRDFDRAKGDAWGKISLTFRRTTDSDGLKEQRRLAKLRTSLVHGVEKLVRENKTNSADETGAEYLQRSVEALDEIERVVKAMRAKTARELKAYPPKP